MKYICKQLQCKQKVPETERPEALDSYPHLRDWLRTINLGPELIQVGRLGLFGATNTRHVGEGSVWENVLNMSHWSQSQWWKVFLASLSCQRLGLPLQTRLVRKVTLLHYWGKNKVLFSRQIPPGGLKMWFPAYFCLLPGPSLSKWREPFYITLWELPVIFAPIFCAVLFFIYSLPTLLFAGSFLFLDRSLWLSHTHTEILLCHSLFVKDMKDKCILIQQIIN